MSLQSILFPDPALPRTVDEPPTAALFRDLNLDQIIASVTARKDEYDLKPLFLAPLVERDSVRFRQEVFADLERPGVYELLSTFAKARLVAAFDYRVRDLRADDLVYNHYHRARYFLNAAIAYCDAVRRLEQGLSAEDLQSRALRNLRAYLDSYVASTPFVALDSEATALRRDLDAIRYCVLVKGDRITVGPYAGEEDYSEQVLATFARFQQGATTNYLPDFKDYDAFAGAGVLDLVAKVFPEVFRVLDEFCAAHLDYLDDTVRSLDREVQFYLSYVDYLQPLRDLGLPFSAPQLSTSSKSELVRQTFDLALASKLADQGAPVVLNDLALSGPERIVVVTGPNNGGKTTFARTFGQLHYLARLGCPVPGSEARLFLCDRIFTHFEREEDVASLVGKLQGDLNRLKADFDRATPASVFVLNEMFNSTSAEDALFLSKQILGKIDQLDALCVCVTFLDELASLSETVVSMLSTVAPDDPATRTYKVVRKPADGRAYAQAIAGKYGLSYERLTEKILR